MTSLLCSGLLAMGKASPLFRIWSRCSYRECVTLFTQELDFLSGDDLEWVMGRGIRECLQWRDVMSKVSP